MSWFKHKPRLKIPPKPQPHHYSPIADKMLRESKERVRETDKKSKKD
jgi:hypothetical protein